MLYYELALFSVDRQNTPPALATLDSTMNSFIHLNLCLQVCSGDTLTPPAAPLKGGCCVLVFHPQID